MDSSTEITTQPNTQRRLTEAQKRSIIAAVAQGETKQSVAQRFHCHPNTVSNLCKGIAGLPTKGISSSLEEFRKTIDTKSFGAIEASVDDREDVHKAANTGLQWLKGVGVLQGDNQVNVTVQAMIAAVPPDWASDMIPTPEPVLPTTSCDHPSGDYVATSEKVVSTKESIGGK